MYLRVFPKNKLKTIITSKFLRDYLVMLNDVFVLVSRQ